ncbi:MAG TPA: excinuclease ABC subunit UvrC [Candidatus Nitrosotenuis sp.]|nr:excinuclease ABC subunit UvrC [Candidatus Nitrosotenuis sp.]
MNSILEKKLKQLPREPGIYFHKSSNGEIIYIGKAASLKSRVRQYFQKSRLRDLKTDALVAEIFDTDWITVETELDALFLESEMIKRYKPRYNVLLRDDKSQTYIRINMKDAYPYVGFTRGPQDDGATYFGPYYNGWAVKKALRFLRRVFPYSTHDVMPKRPCLQYHIGLCPGVEAQKISSLEYKETLKKLMRYLKGERKSLVREIEIEMKLAAREHRFEDAMILRNRMRDIKSLQNQIVFSDKEFMDISKDQGLAGLQTLLGLKDVPRRIEGYDISHMSGTNNVASMVVATNGLADKAQYRKFKMQLPGNNDFGHMSEVMSRRFSGRHDDWQKPDLLLIDGGKGQLTAALDALEKLDIHIPTIGLAKRQEDIVIHRERSNVNLDSEGIKAWKREKNPFNEVSEMPVRGRGLESKYVHLYTDDGSEPGMMTTESDFVMVSLPKNSHIVKLLQRIRDESHRFAVSYHSTLKRKAATKSLLDEIPGIGPATRRKLINSFGSGKGVAIATKDQLMAVLGEKKGAMVYIWFHSS